MRLHAHYSMFEPAHFKGWHTAVLSIGVHLLVLAFLPALLMDLSIKKLNDKKKILHILEVPKKPEVRPQVELKIEPKPVHKEQILPQPIKREVVLPEPREVSPVPQPASDAISSAQAVNPTARLVTGHSGAVDTSTSQFQARAIGEISGNATVATSRRITIASQVPEPFATKPLLPAMIEETQISKEDLLGLENGFASLIRERIAAAKTYPTAARQAGQEGKVLVAFVLDKDGHILDLSVQRSSGHEKLDEAAVEAVKKAASFPPIPEKLKRETMSFKLPISFNLR